MAKYITKTQRAAEKRAEETRRMNASINQLLIKFGNFVLSKRQINDTIVEKDLIDFAEFIKK